MYIGYRIIEFSRCGEPAQPHIDDRVIKALVRLELFSVVTVNDKCIMLELVEQGTLKILGHMPVLSWIEWVDHR